MADLKYKQYSMHKRKMHTESAMPQTEQKKEQPSRQHRKEDAHRQWQSSRAECLQAPGTKLHTRARVGGQSYTCRSVHTTEQNNNTCTSMHMLNGEQASREGGCREGASREDASRQYKQHRMKKKDAPRKCNATNRTNNGNNKADKT